MTRVVAECAELLSRLAKVEQCELLESVRAAELVLVPEAQVARFYIASKARGFPRCAPWRVPRAMVWELREATVQRPGELA